VETQGIIIWARSGAGSLIVWCADSGALVYVADRSRAGDPNAVLCIGDFVDLRVETQGAMRVGRDLRYHTAGTGWVAQELIRECAADRGPVMSPRPHIASSVGFGPGVVDDMAATVPANCPAPSGTGAA